MQSLIQVYCKSKTASLRQTIVNDLKLLDYNLYVSKEKSFHRANRWAKILSSGNNGVLNINWDSKSNLLSVRAINKKSTKSDLLVGNFISYLMGVHKKKIVLINIIPN